MPHLILEASSNIIETNDKVKVILQDCQNLLVDKLPTKLTSCKSRLVLHDVFVLGEGDASNAFIHLSVRVLKGRTPELLHEVAKLLVGVLGQGFSKSSEQLHLGISVEITELNDSYASATTN